MLQVQNRWRPAPGIIVGLLVGLTLLSGCRPTGRRALLEGDALLQSGKPTEAIPLLEKAASDLQTDGEAWTHLGRAYHELGRTADARKAYLRALQADRNQFEAHYNLGQLSLETGAWRDAEAGFRTWLGVGQNSSAGPTAGVAWRGLGLAQFRQGNANEAERSFGSALRLNAEDAESWNAVGLIRQQRRLYRDAFNAFAHAARLDSRYPAPRLNAAVVAHQFLNDRRAALEFYRTYLALNPPEAATISQLIAQLEGHSGAVATPVSPGTGAREVVANPPPARVPPVVPTVTSAPLPSVPPAVTPPSPVAAPTTVPSTRPEVALRPAAPAIAPATGPATSSSPPRLPGAVAPASPVAAGPTASSPPGRPPVAVAEPALRPTAPAPTPTRLPPVTPPPIATAPVVTPVPTPTTAPIATTPARPVVETPPVTLPPPVVTPSPVEVVRIEERPAIQPARDSVPPALTIPPVAVFSPEAATPLPDLPAAVSEPASAGGVALEASSRVVGPESDAARRSFWSRANPVNWFKRDRPVATTNPGKAVTPLDFTADPLPPTPTSAVAPAPVAEVVAIPAPAPAPPIPTARPKPTFPRYQRQLTTVPSAGDRSEAQTEFQRALDAHRRGDLPTAMTGYEQAIRRDPSYYEAQHNLSLAAVAQGNLPVALRAAETATVLRPADPEARYQFAVALQKNRHPDDAVAELEEVARIQSNNAASHLAAAMIYANDLDQPDQARPHYEEVLALEPGHPQAPAIRRWLINHPRR